MRLVFMGSPLFAVPALSALFTLAPEHTVVGVFTQPPRQKDRGHKQQPTPVHTLALEHNTPVYTPLKLDATAQEALKALAPDLIIVAAYGLLLPQTVLNIAPCINIHPSALPRWRGAAPIHHTVIAGDTTAEICLMEMEKTLDTGPVYLREPLTLSPLETAGTLHDKAAKIGAEKLMYLIKNWAAYKNTATPQQEEGATYAHKIEKADRNVNFNQNAARVAAHINGLSPQPGATANLEGTAFKLLLAEPTPYTKTTTPGEIVKADNTNGIVIACATGAIRLKSLQKAGKPAMDDLTFLRGHPLQLGQLFT